MATRSIALAALAVAFLSSCTSKEGGSPTGVSDPPPATSRTTTPPSSSSAADELPTDGAPKVEQPLALGKFVDEPCSALTAAQAANLGVKFPGEADASPLGPTCVWTNPGGASINLGFNQKDGGLSGVYRANKAGKWEYFQEQPAVSGYPAVTALRTDTRNIGTCALDIGVRDDVLLSVDLAQSVGRVGSEDPCKVTARVAEQILQTVKTGG
ncbi:DUF3558 domain-containing protein [Actinokineospora spheciospongiae]|uniref:DUF3558 domain-containing protein n=1 Tax=Actinokineospora spheciospongiae TaxID=909613 RepID=UPI0015E84720|nr:DUF3558 domain-containing protein [Actinokineospora spheciospongiae]